MEAVEAGAVSLAELLLASHADPNAMDNEGRSALIFAVRNTNAELVRALLRMGANPAIYPQSGLNPLELARQKPNCADCREIIKLLLPSKV
jgi:ankyrin repeat protein